MSSLHETGRIDWIVEAAERIIPFAPDVVLWACTSGSFIKGRRFAEQQVAALEQAMGKPAGSTSLAFAAAARQAGSPTRSACWRPIRRRPPSASATS